MKRILALVMAVVLVMSLAACATAGSGELKVSVFWYDEADVYLSSVRAELNAELEKAQIKYDNQFAGKDQAKQLEQIKTAIAGGSNLLVVNVVTSGDPDVAQSIVDAAGKIPLSSSTALSAPKAPMSPCWVRTAPLASSAPTLPKPATCRAR